jgi:NitT/TauT family transport system permease protein
VRRFIPWGTRGPADSRAWFADPLVFACGLALFYGVIALAQRWLAPFVPGPEISLDPRMLPLYAGYSLLRMALAYVLSLGFALVYGYLAATRPRLERFMIPALDVLQSIPVLSFLPGVVLAMVALFPHREIGVELGSILLIFTPSGSILPSSPSPGTWRRPPTSATSDAGSASAGSCYPTPPSASSGTR